MLCSTQFNSILGRVELGRVLYHPFENLCGLANTHYPPLCQERVERVERVENSLGYH